MYTNDVEYLYGNQCQPLSEDRIIFAFGNSLLNVPKQSWDRKGLYYIENFLPPL